MASGGHAAIARLVDPNRHRWGGFAPDRWAQESHRAALRTVYGQLPLRMVRRAWPTAPVSIDHTYVNQAIPAAQHQLAQATVRLIDVFNASLN